MRDPIIDAARSLSRRLEKEARRNPEYSTANVGGITLTGSELERLLRRAASLVFQSQGESLDSVLRAQRLPKGSGTYLRMFAQHYRGQPGHPVLGAMARDARRGERTSILYGLVDLRNAVAHEADVYDAEAVQKILVRANDWWRSVVSGLEETKP
jgi:hypothetical protein